MPMISFFLKFFKKAPSLLPISKINFGLVKQKIGFITNNYLMFIIAGFNGQIDKIIIPGGIEADRTG